MEEEINLISYFRILLKWKKSMALIIFFVTLFSVVVSLLLPKQYKASLTILPISGGMKQGGIESLVSTQGLSNILGGHGSSPVLVLLKSRTLAERVIVNGDLTKVLYPDLWDEENKKWRVQKPEKLPSLEESVRRLDSLLKIVEDRKSGLIFIEVTHRSPVIAAQIANKYAQELDRFISENAFTVAKRNRIFVQNQLEKSKADLLEAGKDLGAFYASKGISNLNPNIDVNVAISPEDHETPEKEEAAAAVLPASPPVASSNTDSLGEGLPGVPNALADVQKETEKVQGQVQDVEKVIQKVSIVKDVPQQVYLQYLVLRRNLLGRVNGLLTEQYEMARIEEKKDDINFQVVDWARVPEKRFKPRRRQIVMTGFVVSFFGAILYAFIREYWAKIKEQFLLQE